MSWEIWFLLWAILSVVGVIYCFITSFWILLGISIASLILCITLHTMVNMLSHAYDRYAKQSAIDGAISRQSMLEQGYEIIEEKPGYLLWGKKNNLNNSINTSQHTPGSTNNTQIKNEL